MEPEVRSFFVRILYSLTMGLMWMVVNMWAGIYMGWFFFENNMKTGNIIFYSFLILSFAALIWYYVKLWRGKI
ncbi:MAG TPA: hypothetical protein VD996_13440 [Chitinophagaceae bacterium]|nr:hypothetical protein [Chitinophagaceae bacterium]